MNAAQEGNTEECERLLLNGVNPNSSNEVCIFRLTEQKTIRVLKTVCN